jgi:DNA-binding LytR/AlgR family response regulator
VTGNTLAPGAAPVTALIAEDESVLRQELREALAATWPELAIVGEAADGLAALRGLGELSPDVLFLDIEMPGVSGLEVAHQASGRCHVVFVTAYDQYAVSAFDEGAVDYLLKPLSPSRLARAVARLRERLAGPPARLDALLASLASRPAKQNSYLRWINASQGNRVRLITVAEICYFQADSKYTRVVTVDGEALIRKAIKDLVQELDPDAFWRIHRSTVVNVGEVTGVCRDVHGRLTVQLRRRRETLPVSEPYAHLFRQM